MTEIKEQMVDSFEGRNQSARTQIAFGSPIVRTIASVAVSVGLAIYLVAPLWADTLFMGVDLPIHVRAAFSAKTMLDEGQFILMYLNDSLLVLQPEFLYHSPICFYISGLAQILFKINASNSILIVYAVCIVLTVIGQILVLEHLSVNFW